MRQDYGPPPELCLRNGSTCAQGNVPLYAVNATAAEHIQVCESPHLAVSVSHFFLGWCKICSSPQPSCSRQILWPRLLGPFDCKEFSTPLDCLLQRHLLY